MVVTFVVLVLECVLFLVSVCLFCCVVAWHWIFWISCVSKGTGDILSLLVCAVWFDLWSGVCVFCLGGMGSFVVGAGGFAVWGFW